MSAAIRIMRAPKIPLLGSLLVCGALVLSTWLADWATPRLLGVEDAPRLEDTVPRQFGDWKELPNPYAQVSLSTGLDPSMDQPYDQTVMRTYVNSQGRRVMLALAWGKRQRQEVKIHRPDLCYVAQGYEISSLTPHTFASLPTGKTVQGKHMVATSTKGGEAVAYWIRIGGIYSESALETRSHILREGFAGRIPDGILVRASHVIRSPDEAQALFPVLEQFLAALYEATPAQTRPLLIR